MGCQVKYTGSILEENVKAITPETLEWQPLISLSFKCWADIIIEAGIATRFYISSCRWCLAGCPYLSCRTRFWLFQKWLVIYWRAFKNPPCDSSNEDDATSAMWTNVWRPQKKITQSAQWPFFILCQLFIFFHCLWKHFSFVLFKTSIEFNLCCCPITHGWFYVQKYIFRHFWLTLNRHIFYVL